MTKLYTGTMSTLDINKNFFKLKRRQSRRRFPSGECTFPLHRVSKKTSPFVFLELLCQTSTSFNKIWQATSGGNELQMFVI